jgi:hypothetical protein
VMRSPCLPKVRPVASCNSLKLISAESDLSGMMIAAAKHEAFLKARGRHYSNEGEAMKVRTCTSSWICIRPLLCFAC